MKLTHLILFFTIVWLILFVSACNSNYYDRNGKKFTHFMTPKDHNTIDSITLELNSVGNVDVRKIDHPLIKYILPTDVLNISKNLNDNLLIIFYYPNCGSSTKYFDAALYAEKMNYPYLLISINNDTILVNNWLKGGFLKQTHKYILPSGIGNSKNILKKQNDFIHNICDSCYQKYRDELIYVSFMVIKNNGEIVLDLNDKALIKQDDIKVWIDKNMRPK